MDWNWFFSSFSQSAAALIGILSAFIISKLLGQNEKIETINIQYEKLKIEYKGVMAKIANIPFKWFTKTTVRYNDELKNQVKAGKFNRKNKNEIIDEIYKQDIAPYKIDEAVFEAFQEFEELYSHSKQPIVSKVGDTAIVAPKPDLDLDFLNNATYDELEKVKRQINDLEIKSNNLIDRFKHNKNIFSRLRNTNKQLVFIIIVLMIALISTVVYPLHFLPLSSNHLPTITFNIKNMIFSSISIKFLLLFVMSLLFEGIFVYFLIQVRKINNEISLLDRIDEKYVTIGKYCKYFKRPDEVT